MSKDMGKRKNGDVGNVNETLSAFEYEPPLLELFTRLRDAGLPLGIDEYQLVLRSLQAGFGVGDKAALKRLCQTLWVKSAEEKRLFEYQFEEVMATEIVVSTPKTRTKPYKQHQISQLTRYLLMGILGVGIVFGVVNSSKESDQTQTISPPQLSPLPNVEQEVKQINQLNQNSNQSNWIFQILLSVIGLSGGYVGFRAISHRNIKQNISQSTFYRKATLSSQVSHLPSELTQIIEDEVQVAKAVLQATSKNEDILDSRFILTTEHFPITERQMKQIWRYLRRPIRQGSATELDLQATINQIGRQGLLLEPVLVPRRVNRAEMLLLIDQDGSMVPFHTLSSRLAETAVRGGRLGKAGIYYFHNCPTEYLYHDPNHQKAELVTDIVTNICSERTAILIFSDAGAARGGHNKERYEFTKEFLGKLKMQVRYVAWLNPMPRERWAGTTGGEIARLIPMFEINRRGVQDAISMLRGRPTNFEGRKK
ncbi:hypothetical protein CEN39_25300 [Fischerella thermalis CCMEE 5201]|nr:hypothetical protein CEN39_25300 [Fischerella thermalis CCMEE 5201]